MRNIVLKNRLRQISETFLWEVKFTPSCRRTQKTRTPHILCAIGAIGVIAAIGAIGAIAALGIVCIGHKLKLQFPEAAYRLFGGTGEEAEQLVQGILGRREALIFLAQLMEGVRQHLLLSVSPFPLELNGFNHARHIDL